MKKFLTVILILMTIPLAGIAMPTDTLRIAHVCDPQLGFYGPEKFEYDLDAFRREIAIINKMRPDIVLIAGDMVNKMDSADIVAFKEAAKAFEVPFVYTPGNHDLPEPVSAKNLKRYRDAFGTDFSVTDCKGRSIISINSMLLRGGPADEVAAHNAKFDKALQEALEAGKPVIVLSHVPPFKTDIDEEDEYSNLHKDSRRGLLGKVANAGCSIWLAGHTHMTAHNEYGGVHILNAENTSANFDYRPRGFRLLTVAPDGQFTWDFVGID